MQFNKIFGNTFLFKGDDDDDEVEDNPDDPPSTNITEQTEQDIGQTDVTGVGNLEKRGAYHPPKIRKRKSADAEKLDAAFNILATAAKRDPRPNECQLFGNLVATKLQKYSPSAQTAVQEAIMHILFRADRGYYNTYQNMSSPSPLFPLSSQNSTPSSHSPSPNSQYYSPQMSHPPTPNTQYFQQQYQSSGPTTSPPKTTTEESFLNMDTLDFQN